MRIFLAFIHFCKRFSCFSQAAFPTLNDLFQITVDLDAMK